MKHKYSKAIAGTLLMASLMVGAGCSDLLDENPRSIFTPEYFKTEAGVQGGLTALYGSLRLYGSGYMTNAYQDGTDETTWGGNSDNNVWQLDFSGKSTISPQSSNTNLAWGAAFPAINTASGVIENGSEAGVSSALLAEAYFFRAFWYLQLVQTYGGVPLDLGAGELKFNTSTSRVSVRNTVTEVYTKTIFPDLLQAIADLGNARMQGSVTKTAAQLFLAKAYLTYGWWLENPNNIPTYPACDRTDPDGHDAAWYYQQAYTVAIDAIQNPAQGLFGDATTIGAFGLQPTFYDVNYAPNDRNSEILLYADHTENSSQYNGSDPNGFSGGSIAGPESFTGWFQQFNYATVHSSSSNTEWVPVSSSAANGALIRAATQALGRPWTMNAPPHEVITNTFADKTNDSRYDGTFVTSYRAVFDLTGATAPLYGANFVRINDGDPVITFLPQDHTPGVVDYSNTTYKSMIGGGVLPDRADFVVEPSQISRTRYPGNWKVGPYRSVASTAVPGANASSTRPFSIAKFSELFFIAAEAAVKGATPQAVTGTYANDGTARGLINVLRARAGVWHFDNGANTAVSIDHSADMIAATPTTIDINYILAERSREFFGEGYRWLDLVRTQTWAEIGATYTIGNSQSAGDWGNYEPETITRTIVPTDYLRPIPQGQLDGLDMSAEEKAAYQNPGY